MAIGRQKIPVPCSSSRLWLCVCILQAILTVFSQKNTVKKSYDTYIAISGGLVVFSF
ncbi:hypothetical protein Leryth_012617 [Lithospermum erythrorhizon]|nr:hypothetical protein Leryth_012617 [Lithospermum erythrorhizon]